MPSPAATAPAPASSAAKPVLPSLSQCRIEQDTIALFGSGNSILDLAEEERAHLLKKCSSSPSTTLRSPGQPSQHVSTVASPTFSPPTTAIRPKTAISFVQAMQRSHAIAPLGTIGSIGGPNGCRKLHGRLGAAVAAEILSGETHPPLWPRFLHRIRHRGQMV